MLVERCEFLIKEGSENDFAAVLAQKVRKLLVALDGVKSVKFGRGVENPSKFILLVEWDTIDAHTAFQKDPRNEVLRASMLPFVVSGAMEHFNFD